MKLPKIYLPAKSVDVATVIEAVANLYHYTPEDILSKKRPPALAFARQVAMYLATQLCTDYSLSEIAVMFRRDHGTVGYARDRIAGILLDAKGNDDAEALQRYIGATKEKLTNFKAPNTIAR